MDETQQQSNVDLAAPGGWRAKFSGISAPFILIALVVAGCALILYLQNERFGVQSDQDAVRFLEQHKVTQQLLTTVITNQASIIREVQASRIASVDEAGMIVYVLTLNQKDRESLKLSMPAALRRQVNTR